MGTQGSYTDFHIDFGGSSVWYHVLVGAKEFYMLPPTPQNLHLYEKWVSSPDQSEVFLSDLAECKTIKVVVKAGNTLLIPSGWIHSVFTPCDTLVVGGNFLHSDAIEMQLTIFDIEERTKVPYNCRFPFFVFMQWYWAAKFVKTYKPRKLSLQEREGILAQIHFLTRWELFFPNDILPPSYYLHALCAILKGEELPQVGAERLYCVCRRPDVPGETKSWVACDYCSEWIHLECTGLPNPSNRRIDCYFCPDCVSKVAAADLNYFRDKRKRSNQVHSHRATHASDKSKSVEPKRQRPHSAETHQVPNQPEVTNASTLAIKIKWKGETVGQKFDMKRRRLDADPNAMKEG